MSRIDDDEYDSPTIENTTTRTNSMLVPHPPFARHPPPGQVYRDRLSQPQSNFTFPLMRDVQRSPLDGFYTNDLAQLTLRNNDYRRVISTSSHQQLVVMAIQTGTPTGEEVHPENDQFFRIEQGVGTLVINGREVSITADSAFIVPRGARHNVISTGEEPLKLYTIYSPPHHAPGRVDRVRPATG